LAVAAVAADVGVVVEVLFASSVPFLFASSLSLVMGYSSSTASTG
jgi:hypothetical protein